MKAGHLSNKEFKEQCSTSSMQCKKAKQCYVHEGRTNLKKLRHLLKKIEPNHMGWKTGIKWNIEKKGSIETLINLREDLLKTKRMINNFNENRLKLMKFIQEIDYFLELKTKNDPHITDKEKKETGDINTDPQIQETISYKSKFSLRRNDT